MKGRRKEGRKKALAGEEGGGGWRAIERGRERAGKGFFFFCDKSDGTLPRPAPARGAQTYA